MKAQTATFLIVTLLICAQGAQPIYFLVTPIHFKLPESEKESFVIPITDESLLAEARRLVELAAQPTWPTPPVPPAIVLADVVPGRDAINRNYSLPQFPEWSWHVSRIVGFSELCTCDELQRPSEIERAYTILGSTSELKVAMDYYTITRELGATPLQISLSKSKEAMEVYWSSPGDQYRFTLQTAVIAPIGIPDWHEVEGAVWPMKTNHWSLPLHQSGALFRVMAVRDEEGLKQSH